MRRSRGSLSRLALPLDRLVLIPAMAALFGVGRIAFWIGYLVYPIGRAFGMVLTVAPTLGAYRRG